MFRKGGLEIGIICNTELKLLSGIENIRVRNFDESLSLTQIASEFYIFRPTINLSELTIKNLKKTPAKLIAWMHVTPSVNTLRTLSKIEAVRGVVALGNRQSFSWIDNPISNKTYVIKNGQFPSKIPATKFEKKYITYLGALVPQKGFHVLAKAWPEIAACNPHLELRVIGSGNLYDNSLKLGTLKISDQKYERKIVALLGDSISSVNFLGKLSAGEKSIEISKSYLGIVNPTGNTENCPAAALDFQSAGIPVVGANKYGIIDTVQHKQTGYLIKREKDLAKTINWLVEKEFRRDFYASNTVNFVVQEFNFDKIILNWIEFMNKLDVGYIRQWHTFSETVNFGEKMALINSYVTRNYAGYLKWPTLTEIKIFIKSVLGIKSNKN